MRSYASHGIEAVSSTALFVGFTASILFPGTHKYLAIESIDALSYPNADWPTLRCFAGLPTAATSPANSLSSTRFFGAFSPKAIHAMSQMRKCILKS